MCVFAPTQCGSDVEAHNQYHFPLVFFSLLLSIPQSTYLCSFEDK